MGHEHSPWCQEAAWSSPGRGQRLGAAGRRMEEEEGGTGCGWQGPEGELLRQSHS